MALTKEEYQEWLKTAYKEPTEEEREYGDWLYECVDSVLIDLWQKNCNRVEQYITDVRDQEIRENFAKDTTPEEITERLLKLPHFRKCLDSLVTEWAYKKELEV